MVTGCSEAASPLGDLSPDELALWLSFTRAHGALVRELDHDLRAAHDLPLTDFRILLWLSWGDCARMRMAALADTVHLSPSGLSRAIERLETRELVSRQQNTGDRRGVDARLTEAGDALVRNAGLTHAAGVRHHFLEQLSPDERAVLGLAFARVRATTEAGCCQAGDPAARTHGLPGADGEPAPASRKG